MLVEDIVRKYLIENGYDGLRNPYGGCGCDIDDLIPCGFDCSGCEPGYKIVPPEGIDSDYDSYICSNRDDKPWEAE